MLNQTMHYQESRILLTSLVVSPKNEYFRGKKWCVPFGWNAGF